VHRQDVWTVGDKRGESPEIRRAFERDGITAVDEDAPEEVEGLLAPCRDQDVLGVGSHPFLCHDFHQR
jgi:hypothetical protein